MSEENKPPVEGQEVSAEEKEAEAQGLAEVKEEEVREKIAKELDIDPDNEGELLDKIVKRNLDQRKKLSKSIKQKIAWREKATTKKPGDKKPKGGKEPKEEKPDVSKLINDNVNEALEKRDLESLNLSEEIETEVKDLAKIKGISVREAAKTNYIQSRIEEVKKEERIKSATPKRSNKGAYKTDSYDPSEPLNPDDFNLETKEGRKAWEAAKKAKRKKES